MYISRQTKEHTRTSMGRKVYTFGEKQNMIGELHEYCALVVAKTPGVAINKKSLEMRSRSRFLKAHTIDTELDYKGRDRL